MTSTAPPAHQLLADVDADAIRRDPACMRETLQAVCARGEPMWAGPLPLLTDTLVEVARVDLCLARLVEGHADAVRILAQADALPQPGVYGVWASRSAGTGLSAHPVPGGWRLHGELRFASGVDLLDRALTPGWREDGTHLLLDVPAERVAADRSTWQTAAMDASRSFTVALDRRVPEADVVGPPGHYLDRPGFAVGGLCVAAVWAGGARGVVDLVAAGLSDFDPNPHQLRRVGLMEVDAWQAVRLVRQAAEDLADADSAGVALPGQTQQIARVRTAVVAACDRVLDLAGAVVGPGGLTRNGRLARALADLGLYVRQHHLDLEAARLGEAAVRDATLSPTQPADDAGRG